MIKGKKCVFSKRYRTDNSER